MRKFLKYLSIVLISFLLLLVLAFVGLIFLVDPNHYKADLSRYVSEKTGYPLKVNGNLEWTIFPSFGLKAQQINIGKPEKIYDKDSFFSIKEATIAISLLPLLKDKIIVETLELDTPVIYLIKNPSGVNNWSDAKHTPTPPKLKRPADPPTKTHSSEKAQKFEFELKTLSIKDGKVYWDDQQTQTLIKVRQIELLGKAIKLNQEFPLSFKGAFSSNKLKLQTNIVGKGNLLIDPKQQVYNLKEMDSKIEFIRSGFAKSVLFDLQGSLHTDLARETLNTQNLTLRAQNLALEAQLNGTNIKNRPQWQGHLKTNTFTLGPIIQKFGYRLPDTATEKKAAVQVSFFANPNNIDIKPLTIDLGDHQMTGSLQWQHFPNTQFNIHTHIEALNLDEYLPIRKEAPSKAEGIRSTLLPHKALAASQMSSPLSFLRPLAEQKGSIQAEIDHFTYQGLTASQIKTVITTGDHHIIMNPLKAELYSGKLLGQMKVDTQPRPMQLTLQQGLQNVQIQPLLRDLGLTDKLTGTSDISLKLHSEGEYPSLLLQNLSGEGSIAVHDATLKGINLENELERIKDAAKGKNTVMAGKPETQLGDVTATFKLTKGVVENDDLLAKSNALQIKGKGKANLVTKRLDYTLIASVLKENKPDGIPIPLLVKGSFSDPNIRPDMQIIGQYLASDDGQALLEKANEQIEKQLGTKIDLKKLFQ